MHYYCAYLLLRVVRTSSLRCSTLFALLACFFAPCLVRFPFLSIPNVPLVIFALAFLFRSSRLSLSLSLSPLLPPVVSHGRRGFPQAHSVRLAHHEEREEETKERIRFAVEAVAVKTRSKRRRRRRRTTTTSRTSTTRTRTARTTTTESLRPVRVAENASTERVPAFEVVVVV